MSPAKTLSPLRRILAIAAAIAILVLGTFSAADNTIPSESHHQTPPDTFVFLVDISGSMKDQLSVAVQPRLTNDSKLQLVKFRLARLVHDLPPGTRVIVSVFDDQPSQICDVVLNSQTDRSELAAEDRRNQQS